MNESNRIWTNPIEFKQIQSSETYYLNDPLPAFVVLKHDFSKGIFASEFSFFVEGKLASSILKLKKNFKKNLKMFN